MDEETIKRLAHLEHRLNDLEKQLLRNSIMWQEGIPGGAAREVTELKTAVSLLRADLSTVSTKTTRWEGGGSVLYLAVTVIGALVGWLLAHFGLGGR